MGCRANTRRYYRWPDDSLHIFHGDSLEITVRTDGRVEWVCRHGVGHPIGHLRQWLPWMGVHGCDGCIPPPYFFQPDAGPAIAPTRSEQETTE